MRYIIRFLGLRFWVTQHQWGRRLFGGRWYLIETGLPMSSFWTDKQVTSCQAVIREIEIYPTSL
jgi:hypothetical protein